MSSLRVAIAGCGLIGRKRGLQVAPHKLVGVMDIDQSRAQKLALELNTEAYSDFAQMLNQAQPDVVIVAVSNNQLAPLTLQALRAKKHVLVEKPGAMQLSELLEMKKLALEHNLSVKVGFNHRFHPALLKTRELIDQGALGELMFMRARYGHGARLGYEKEWRAQPELAGGGELLDQGCHILDLIYWFMGPLPLKSALVRTNYWDMKVDDNAVLTVADSDKWATFHVSCSEWKNCFGLELYGRTGKVLIQGLGGSYGKETLTYYKMLPEMGPPKMETFEYDAPDISWELDFKNLSDHLQSGSPLWGDLDSTIYAMTQIRDSYRQNGFEHLPSAQ